MGRRGKNQGENNQLRKHKKEKEMKRLKKKRETNTPPPKKINKEAKGFRLR